MPSNPLQVFPPSGDPLRASTEEVSRPDLTSCRYPTPSSSSTSGPDVDGVEPVEGLAGKPQYDWHIESGLDQNFHAIGRLLASLDLHLYQHTESGLLLIDGDRPRHLSTAADLGPFLIDHVKLAVFERGKYQRPLAPDGELNKMLRSRTFLDQFPVINEIVTTPVVMPDLATTQPGYNEGGVFYLGPKVSPCEGLDAISTFLDVMDWQSNADRTNAVGALLTVPFRRHFPGGKPLILITATKSHSGKSTLVEFIRGNTPKVELLYENVDWPMQRCLHDQLEQYPEAGVINYDNVRIDSSGRGKIIRSGLVESFLTNSEIVLSSTRGKPIRMANRFVVLLNSNEGALSIDLLNRSLPIRLAPSGDLSDRIAKAKAALGGDVKHEWLPAHQEQIKAELWGMIETWVKAGHPLDQTVKHPMGPWAQTIGGILAVNGFTDFLGNYSATRAAADPVREAIGVLAFYAGDKPRRAGDLARIVVRQGLAKTLLAGVDTTSDAACQRTIGVILSPYVGESFTVATAEERITYRLSKQQGRFDGQHPHFRYIFVEEHREQSQEDEHGLVLEECDTPKILADLHLDRFEPETL